MRKRELALVALESNLGLFKAMVENEAILNSVNPFLA